MDKKYIFFDIDGTLTDRRTHQIVPSAQKALDLLQKNGHFVAIATGRAAYKAIPVMKETGLSNMVCSGGHGLVVDGELVENRPLDLEKAKKVIQEATDLGYGVLVLTDDSDTIYGKDTKFLKQSGFRKEKTTYIIDENFDASKLDAIYKIYVSIPQEEEERLTLKDTLGHMRFEKEYLMFQPDEKQQGIKNMMDFLKADCKDVVVFGDDTNDFDMFKGPWYSIAMGNGCQELKDMADEVTEANIDDGIYKACQRHGWI